MSAAGGIYTVADELVFGIRVFAFGDGFNWSAAADDPDQCFGLSGDRS